MIHFLDFDRTLFDTDSYNRSLLAHPACAPFTEELAELLSKRRDESLSGGITRQAVWDKVSALFESGELAFLPGELAPFVYPDAFEVLRMLGNEAVIITYGEKRRQVAKIESALAGVVRLTVLYVEDIHKAEFLSRHPHLVSAPACFVDDHALELEGMERRFPEVALYEMRRDGREGAGRWPVIRTLFDLPS